MGLETALELAQVGTVISMGGALTYYTHRISKKVHALRQDVIGMNYYVLRISEIVQAYYHHCMQGLLSSDNSSREELEEEYNELVVSHHGLLKAQKDLIQKTYRFTPAEVVGPPLLN